MREATNSPYKKLVFRETFRDEQTVRKNGGVPTDVSFNEGVGEFNGSSSDIKYPTINLKNNISIRYKGSVIDGSNGHIYYCGQAGEGWYFSIINGYFRITLLGVKDISFDGYPVSLPLAEDTDIIITKNGTSYKLYINGELKDSQTEDGTYIKTNMPLYMFYNGSSYAFSGNINLTEIYKGTLTASEVANLYNNTWNSEQSFPLTITPKGNNVIVNGTFDTDTGWAKGTGWTISDGTANCDGTNGSDLYQNQSGLIGKKIKVTYDVKNYVSGSVRSYLYGTPVIGESRSANGTYTEILQSIPGNNGNFGFDSVNFVGSVDNVMVQEINPRTLIDFDSTNGSIKDNQVGSIVGEQLCKDAEFDSDDWAASTGWAIVDGVAEATATTDTLISSSLITAGKTYHYRFNATVSSGDFRLWDGGTFLTDLISSSGTYEGTFTAGSANFYFDGSSAFTGSINNVTLFEVRDDLDITDVEVKKIGSNYAADFNGTSSKIDLNTNMINTKAVTVLSWVNIKSNGENGNGRIINEGQTIFYVNNNSIKFSSDSSSFTNSDNIDFNIVKFVALTRESDGTVNFYIGDLETAPALSGVADQDSGTPTAGTTNVVIGNNDGANRTFDGLIPKLKVVEGILDIDEITRYWSETRKEVK